VPRKKKVEYVSEIPVKKRNNYFWASDNTTMYFVYVDGEHTIFDGNHDSVTAAEGLVYLPTPVKRPDLPTDEKYVELTRCKHPDIAVCSDNDDAVRCSECDKEWNA